MTDVRIRPPVILAPAFMLLFVAFEATADERPMPAPRAPIEASARAQKNPYLTRQPTGPPIEGNYSIEGNAAGQARVGRIYGDVVQVASTDGWESVGYLDGAIYRGVFRHRGSPEIAEGTMGELTIDWSIPDRPSLQGTYATKRTGQFSQRWQRTSAPELRAPMPPDTMGAPPRRPPQGEYVYTDELPELITRVEPIPPANLRPEDEGTVQLSVHVLEDGSVGEIRVIKSIPKLDEAAITAAKQFRFKAARAKGAPVAVWVVVPVRFTTRH